MNYTYIFLLGIIICALCAIFRKKIIKNTFFDDEAEFFINGILGSVLFALALVLKVITMGW